MIKRREVFMSLPSMIWLTLFYVLPTIIVLVIAFKPHDIYGGLEAGWTLDNLRRLFSSQALHLIVRTGWISALATFFTVLLAVPVGYYLAQLPERWRTKMLLAIILPFWTSFLIRIFAWKSILHPEAFLKQVLVSWHLVAPETQLLYNSAAVVFIMVYTYLPFGILPIYAAASKFDFQLYEAALDLGATRTKAFFRVFIPAIWQGIVSSILMVFIPVVGAYVIPDVVGGPGSEMVGNRIGQKILVARNLPEASAWALLLMGAILLPMLLWASIRGRSAVLRNLE